MSDAERDDRGTKKQADTLLEVGRWLREQGITAAPLRPPSLEDYVAQAMANLRATSRTAQRVVDVSSAPGKARKNGGPSGEQAAQSTIVLRLNQRFYTGTAKSGSKTAAFQFEQRWDLLPT
jgi:hypothetical protein